MDKQELRKKYKEKRSRLSEAAREDLSLAIANQALKLPIWEANYFHIYLPIQDKKEVNTEYLLHILQGKDKSVILSKTDFKALTMKHILLQENTLIKISEYGIPEPVDGIEIATSQIEVVFVPLLAYDVKGNRIGYGKGFYDRFLAQCSNDIILVGLSFFKAEERIEKNATDIPLDFIVTPENTTTF
ncbi:MAG: 5-formyltetrahydrofolate cyclo-ligase [Planctomycetota bacterium]|jgi:5-formyltetrahydrofolate cyclo-ligase|uniref:5-formyltetrahydrofolate cyclo-ligase n=1 Tax=Patiriisocius sp. Uisw_047 TaxID=3230969 RepID=UPI0039E803D1